MKLTYNNDIDWYPVHSGAAGSWRVYAMDGLRLKTARMTDEIDMYYYKPDEIAHVREMVKGVLDAATDDLALVNVLRTIIEELRPVEFKVLLEAQNLAKELNEQVAKD